MPSQKILAAKQEAVATLAAKMRTASAGVLVKYEGITVEDDTKLRAALRAAGVEASVDVYPDWYHAYDMFFPFKKKAKEAIAKFEAEFVSATEKYFREQE